MHATMTRKPSSVIVAGPSGSGKSYLVDNWLRNPKRIFEEVPDKMVYCYDRWQPLFGKLQKDTKVKFYKGLPPEGQLGKWFGP